MARTLEQKIAALDAKIARLRYQERKLETGQKIILGGLLLKAAHQDKYLGDLILKIADIELMREIDKTRLEPLLQRLRNGRR